MCSFIWKIIYNFAFNNISSFGNFYFFYCNWNGLTMGYVFFLRIIFFIVWNANGVSFGYTVCLQFLRCVHVTKTKTTNALFRADARSKPLFAKHTATQIYCHYDAICSMQTEQRKCFQLECTWSHSLTEWMCT